MAFFLRKEIVQPAREKYMTSNLEWNYATLILKLNIIREAYGKPMIITSGFRPAGIKTTAGTPTSSTSRHAKCLAVDVDDVSGDFYRWIITNERYIKYGVSVEDRKSTPTWCHIDCEKRNGVHKIFKP